MVYRKTLIFLVLTAMISQTGALDVSTGSSCGDRKPMVSLNNTSGGHIGEPGYYSDNKVCVSEVKNFAIRSSCNSDENAIFSMEQKNNSHLSIHDNEYLYQMCAHSIISAVRTSCNTNETKVLSLTSDNNTHAAAASYTTDPFNQSLCLKKDSPQNVTVKLSGLSGSIYADDASISSGASLSPPVGFPYIVSDQPTGIVSYGNFLKLSRVSTGKVSITQKADSGSFLIPFTQNGYQEVEDEENQVVDREFLGSVSSSFGFGTADDPTVKVRFESPYSLKGFSDTLVSGTYELKIKNKGLDGENLTISIQPN